MTLPTQTWRVSPKYNVAMAGSSPTLPELFQAIKDMIDAENTAATNYWTYGSFYSSGNDHYITFKRKGSPSGTLGTFRAIAFGNTGGTINAANAHFNVSVSTGLVFVASSKNINIDGVSNLPTAGALYSTEFNPGVRVVTTGDGNIVAVNAMRVFMVECDTMCSIWFTSTATANGGFHFTFGEIIEKVDGTSLWGHWGTRAAVTGNETGTNAAAAPNGITLPVDNVSTQVPGAIWDGSSKGWGVLNQMLANDTLALSDQTASIAGLWPLLTVVKPAAGATPVHLLGVLRQMRWTIPNVGQMALLDGALAVKAYLINAGYNVSGRGLAYDQAP